MIQISKEEAERIKAQGVVVLDMWGIEHILIQGFDLLVADVKQDAKPAKDDPENPPLADYG